jgi:hypothetical protein
LKKWIIHLIVASGLTASLYFWRGQTLSSLQPQLDYYFQARYLCDAFSVVGLVYLLMGSLLLLSNEGAFDSMTYGVKKTMSYLKLANKEKLAASYFDYVQAKSQNPKVNIQVFLIIGSLFLAIGIVFLFLYL